MKKRIICFSDNGKAVTEKLNRGLEAASLEPAEDCTGMPVDDFAREGFGSGSALIFVGAAGIAVRAISPYVKDKTSDSPVIVIDDAGTFVIPILSGHAGGANKIASCIAALLGAVPVITTSTDVNSAFSADVFAAEQRLTVRNREGIKKVSAKALEGKRVTISIKDYPPDDAVDIIIADETDKEYDLLLSPKRYTVGVGMRKNMDPGQFEEFVLDILGKNGILPEDIYAVATVDIKEEEAALRQFCDRFRVPLVTFSASVLDKAKGDFTASGFVKDTVGVDNVCERAAILAAGTGGTLEVKKTSGNGITVAVAKRP